MTTAIVMLSVTIGFFLGYKVGYSRCSYQFKKALGAVRDWSQREFEKNKRQ